MVSALNPGGSKTDAMGLLDDLEAEAQRRKATLDEADRLKQERQTAYKSVLEPGMQALHEYLSKLTTNLAFLKPKTRVQHEIPGYGAIVAYLDHEYDLKANKLTPGSKEITLVFNALVAMDECPSLEVQGAAKVRTLNSVFQKYRLAALHEFKKDDNGEMVSAVFRARGKIPMSMQVLAEADTGLARVSFTNFDTLGVATKNYAAAQFNAALFDEIGRFVAREPNSLFREAVSDDFRKQLQQKIQHDQMRRKWETKIAEQQREDMEKLRNEQKLGNKLGKAVAEVKEKAPGLLDRVKGIFKKP